MPTHRSMLSQLFLASLAWLCLAGAAQAADTLVVVVRHAEKASDDPRDPSLSESGQARARALARAIAGLYIRAAYVTQFRRTRLTAVPAAEAVGIEPTVVPAGEQTAADAVALATRIHDEQLGQSVLVVGHSNTVNALVEALGGGAQAAVREDEFDRLYLISIDDHGAARVVISRY